VAERPGSEPTSPVPRRRDDALWMATKGTRWFLRRSVDLIPYMLFMAAREALAEQREWPVATVPAGSGPACQPPFVNGAPVAGDAKAEPVTD
jgi:hypothetical protein